jgi:hypothetical protein
MLAIGVKQKKYESENELAVTHTGSGFINRHGNAGQTHRNQQGNAHVYIHPNLNQVRREMTGHFLGSRKSSVIIKLPSLPSPTCVSADGVAITYAANFHHYSSTLQEPLTGPICQPDRVISSGG